MAISKELYERYKAMKAAKLAQTEQQSSPASSGQSDNFESHENNSIENLPPQEPENSWTTSYSSEYNQNNYSENHQNTAYDNTTPASESNITENYNKQFEMPTQQIYSGNLTTENNSFVLHKNTSEIKKFALIGYPLGHSLSEFIHKAGFKSIGIKATYEILPTLPQDLAERIKYLRNNGYSGFNVTIPHKLPVTMFLDEIDISANVVNAINTVAIDLDKNILKGYNTDAIGFIKAIPEDFSLYNKTAAILGTGGAARAAITALAQKQVKSINLYSRNIANCMELLTYLRKTFPNVEFNSYQIDKFKDLSNTDIVVNETPIGMSGQGVGYSPLEEDEITTLPSHALIYDVIYNPKRTNLIKMAQKYNYRTLNGMDMLIYQAQEAQKIWLGQTPDFKDMKIAALENI